MVKERADILLAKKGYFHSRTQAQRAIMAGLVQDHQHQRIDKSGTQLPLDEVFYIKETGKKYVSRGGFKLEKALKVFQIDLKDRICLDIGASTGGFTDVALQNGASKVYALDVGYNQLAWRLRDHPQVIVIDQVIDSADHIAESAGAKLPTVAASLRIRAAPVKSLAC